MDMSNIPNSNKKNFLPPFSLAHMFQYDLLWTQGVPKRSTAASAACMRAVVPTASMQEINLRLTQEACRETDRETGWTWWQWAEQPLDRRAGLETDGPTGSRKKNTQADMSFDTSDS